MFGKYDSDLDNVRVNVWHLRKRIDKYYDEVGKDDLVAIEPSRPRLSADVFLSRARRVSKALPAWHGLFEGPAGAEPSKAWVAFLRANRADPTYAPAYARKHEAEILHELLADIFDIQATESIKITDEAAPLDQALELNPQLSCAHILAGVDAAVAGKWQGAEQSSISL